MSFSGEVHGPRFGRYKIVERIGLGGMAEVYRAETSAGKAIAIKTILSSFTGNEKFVGMFLDEAKIMITLRHPNIVELFDFGKIGDVYYLAMEWVDGKPLRSLIKRKLKQNMMFPPELAVYIVMEVTSGLDYAHKKKDPYNRVVGIVHRDISPPNILVSWGGEVKIADFGIAKTADNISLTKPGVIKGKFSYMSPEQARGGELDLRSDIFSLGIILCEMLTGTRLFLRDKDYKTVEAVRKAEVISPKYYNTNIPDSLEAVVFKALARNPKKRFQSAEEFGDALEDVLLSHYPEVSKERLTSFMQFLYPEREVIPDWKKKMEFINFWSQRAKGDLSVPEGFDLRMEKPKKGFLNRFFSLSWLGKGSRLLFY